MLNKGGTLLRGSANHSNQYAGLGPHSGDTLYNVGNIYSGTYHALQSPGTALYFSQAPTLPMRVSEFVTENWKNFLSSEL